ncbi:MAG: hypothetical protein FWD57_13935 [Polyangiaceae bacterium]|nr:hypothetical protein [Polyangiaceae bacterium]
MLGGLDLGVRGLHWIGACQDLGLVSGDYGCAGWKSAESGLKWRVGGGVEKKSGVRSKKKFAFDGLDC